MKLTRFIKYYFIVASILAHCILIGIVGWLVTDKITHHWRWPIIKHWLFGDIDQSAVYPVLSQGWDSLPQGQWVKIHQQQSSDNIHFIRQSHAGSGYDSVNSQLFLFGSNTHAENWNNTVYRFNLDTLQWQQDYPIDSPNDYLVSYQGIPTTAHHHPWAMHSFAAVVYNPHLKRLIVASFPGHLSPDKYGQSLSQRWKKIKKHPTWLYNPQTRMWQVGTGQSIDFFPYTIAYDSDRQVVIGFKPYGIYSWSDSQNGWHKIGQRAPEQFHTNAVYDSVNHVFLLYGGNAMKNDIYRYLPGAKSTETMPTPGIRPPAGQSIPLAFHQQQAKMVALIDSGDAAQTWLYQYSEDRWQRLKTADFPYSVGMNYTMEYDKKRHLIILVSSPDREATAVWVLKLPSAVNLSSG